MELLPPARVTPKALLAKRPYSLLIITRSRCPSWSKVAAVGPG